MNLNIYWEMGEDDWENSNFVPLIPTSAMTEEGVHNILLLLCQIFQRKLWRRLMWCTNLQCTGSVLEVKAINGLGMTINLLVVNEYLREGDKAVFCTLDGPHCDQNLWPFDPPAESGDAHQVGVHAPQGNQGRVGSEGDWQWVEKVMAGTPVLVVGPDDKVEDIKAEVMSDLTKCRRRLSAWRGGMPGGNARPGGMASSRWHQ
jgi:translation initiation factor 5B